MRGDHGHHLFLHQPPPMSLNLSLQSSCSPKPQLPLGVTQWRLLVLSHLGKRKKASILILLPYTFPDHDSPLHGLTPAALELTVGSLIRNLLATLYPLKTVTFPFLLFPGQVRSLDHHLLTSYQYSQFHAPLPFRQHLLRKAAALGSIPTCPSPQTRGKH